MKNQYKSSLLFLIVGMVAMILTTIIHFNLNSELWMKQQESELEAYNKDKIYHLTEMLDFLTDIVMTMSRTPSLIESLLADNASVYALSERDRKEYIQASEESWQSPERDMSLVNSLLINPQSTYFNSIKNLYLCDIGEIFLTNKHGVAIASTAILTTRTHGSKNWWKASFQDGKRGSVFIDDRGFDESV